MTNSTLINPTLNIKIPRIQEDPLSIELSIGNVLFMLGANGTGKSSLLYSIMQQSNGYDYNLVLMSAYRINNFEEDTIDYNIREYQRDIIDIQRSFTGLSRRYKLTQCRFVNDKKEINLTIQQLIQKSIVNAITIKEQIKAGTSTDQLNTNDEIDQLNIIFKKSNFTIELFLDSEASIMVRNNAYTPAKTYPLAQLSDGERAALIITANILCAKPGSVIFLDEPERHLHQRIVSPLLSELIKQRKDCIFIISTHQITLPTYIHNSSILLVRKCIYNNNQPTQWEINFIDQKNNDYSELEEQLKIDLFGSRKTILFVEGNSASLDIKLYQSLFPTISIIPKGSCDNVKEAVKGLRSNNNTHWVNAFGIIDNDNKTPKDIENLNKEHIYSLSVYSIESIYYHPKIIKWILKHAKEYNNIQDDQITYQQVIELIKKELISKKEHLCKRAVYLKIRSEIMASLPKQSDIHQGSIYNKAVDITNYINNETDKFDNYISNQDYDSLISFYPIREASLLNPIAKLCGFSNQHHYEHNVILMLQNNITAKEFILSLLGGAEKVLNKTIGDPE